MRILFIFSIALFCISPNDQSPDREILITGQAQGTTYQIIYYAKDTIVDKRQIDSILNKIDSSLSLYKPYSLINQFNKSDTGIAVDEHFLNVVKKSIDIYHQTNGIFDITVKPLVQSWGFGAKSIDRLPDSATIMVLKQCVNSTFLEVFPTRVGKKKPCIEIDVNGIAQGYSVDVIAGYLQTRNINNYIIELGGEIRLKGRKSPQNSVMTIGIEAASADPYQRGMITGIIAMENGAVTTSGNYKKFYESKGKFITHLINPATGYPSNNEMISVTVIASTAMVADGYDNALMLMGVNEGINFIEKRNDLAAYFIFRKPNGEIGDSLSSRFPRFIN